ncbi:MAG: hypothetical protein AAFQ80_07420 [Cyanobacteria bacterium J06621_8]
MKSNLITKSEIRDGVEYYHPLFEASDIFKYGRLKYLEGTLRDNTLKFSNISDYNDPFEMSFKCPAPNPISEEQKRARLIRNSSNSKVNSLCNDLEK